MLGIFRIKKEQAYIGTSSENDIILDDGFISGEHASIRLRDDQFYLTDLDSRNGTYVNDSECQERIDRVELNDGDEIYLGKVVLKFKCIT